MHSFSLTFVILLLLIDPEYLIERVSRGKKISCRCSVSDAESLEAKNVETEAPVTAVQPAIEETDGAEQLAAETILERCGECNLHSCK